ncbi:unnamed protein product [Ceutorhynchus assimilis]|uniref:Uncharacterized protein n=1 Tax=Ceutorhynchus assimilis TaxID=467358 RepID=A0A9N9QQ10_9CUCU|nr:unnamed protein product [Ceutorhynchus assimilis]
MAKIVCLFALVALVQVATALDCYSCDATTCAMDQSKWQKVPKCGNSIDSTVNTGACLKRQFIDKQSNKEVTTRKCVIANKDANNKVTFTCDEKDGKNVFCEVCNDSNLCNSASSVSFSFVALMGVVAAVFIPRCL